MTDLRNCLKINLFDDESASKREKAALIGSARRAKKEVREEEELPRRNGRNKTREWKKKKNFELVENFCFQFYYL